MNRYEHPFFNPEIKPALIVINLLTGLLLPFFFIAGILAAVIKPIKTYFTGGNIVETVLAVIVGLGFPASIVWSLFATWSRFGKKQYKSAFTAAVFPIIFAAVAVILWALTDLAEWLLELL